MVKEAVTKSGAGGGPESAGSAARGDADGAHFFRLYSRKSVLKSKCPSVVGSMINVS